MIGRFVLTILLAAAALSLPRIWYVMKGGAGVRQFAVSADATSVVDANSLAALSQPYAYLSRGSQMIVFQSQDGKYVLKIPRAAKNRNNSQIGQSFLIAQNELKGETGLLAVHLGRCFDVPEAFVLKDGLGRRIPVHLDQTPFVLQRKMPLLKAELEQAIGRNDRQGAKEILSSFLRLIDAERKRGVQSRDNAFSANFAYEKGKAYRLDIGAYEKKCSEQTLAKAVKPVRRYLAERDPELLGEFDELMQKL